MDVINIKNIVKKNTAPHCREEFSGIAIPSDKRLLQIESKIKFSLERTPSGEKQVDVKFIGIPNYPVINAIRVLEKFILTMRNEGEFN